MVLTSKNTIVTLSNLNGSIMSYKVNGREICAEGGDMRPLFTLKLLDNDGNYIYYNSTEAETISIGELENEYVIRFNNIAQAGISARVNVSMDEKEHCHWHITVDNNTENILEWIEFPQITIPDCLKDNGGDSELFWPVVEGISISDKTIRGKIFEWLGYTEIGGQTGAYCGFYPGSCPMQFMSVYNDENGLYFGAHDCNHNPKTVEWRIEKDGIALEYRLFCGGAQGHFDAGFDMITAPVFDDWQSGAEIYRNWAEKNAIRPKKLFERNDLPEWMDDSPVVMLYPVRGTIDHGDMTPNRYFPYTNVLPVASKYQEEMQSRIMALPMHWEGTAPWAPPYVWPPFGGEDMFKEFVDGLHSQGNLAGVYCSGIGWTTESLLEPSFDKSDKYDENLMCRTPWGTVEQSKALGEPIRHGYDMCPESDRVAELVSSEVVSIASAGVDYAQYFDQNLGGMSCFCYGRDHGHPPAPGKWQNDAMKRIFEKVTGDLKAVKSDMIIGCEGAAGEPFVSQLPLNDLRFNVGYFFGKPVPAYSYIFHEYINNFMGNQNTVHISLSLDNNPYCVLFRIGYSFTAGDMITICLGDEDEIHWGWDVPWDVERPDQKTIITLIKNLNRWRRDKKEFLRYGKMTVAKPLCGIEDFELTLSTGEKLVYPSLLTSRWISPEGKEAQIVVNYLPKEQTFSIEGGKEQIKVSPLSAIWLAE